MMDRSAVVNYCFGILGLVLLQGVLNAEGRSIFNPGKCVKKTVFMSMQYTNESATEDAAYNYCTP